MDPQTATTAAQITIPLSLLVDILHQGGVYDRWIPSKALMRKHPDLGTKLQLLLQSSTTVHLQLQPLEGCSLDDNAYTRDDKGRFSPVVWQLIDWNTHYEKWLQDKKRSEIRVNNYNRSKELIDEVATVFITRMKLDESIANSLARTLLASGQSVGLTGFGFSIEEATKLIAEYKEITK